jgi:hypothetical protein
LLSLLHLFTAATLETIERPGNGRAKLETFGKRDCSLHCQLGPRADREMRRGLGVSEQYHIAPEPAFVANIGKLRNIDRLVIT